ncbi:hypothetical protein [Anaerotignum sp.]|uniref:hypothetical protein n=1 Tax=Anaerotignum sp. TaxID=2039241 RepID=UPI0028981941|nr:hypothetical protein [Anaerotignum sp.]
MDGNTELLNYIYQNSQMGIKTLNQLIEIVEDNDFKKQLQSQLNEYKSINRTALQKLNELGHEEKGIGNMAKISAYMSISIKTLMDKSPCHISQMLIQGSTMGIIDATKNIQKYNDADKQILQLADKLLKTEQNNIEQLKPFLE